MTPLPARLPWVGATPLPHFVSSTRLAKALDVPCVSWSGREPKPPPEVTFGRPSTREGALTWFLTALLALGVGFLVFIAIAFVVLH